MMPCCPDATYHVYTKQSINQIRRLPHIPCVLSMHCSDMADMDPPLHLLLLQQELLVLVVTHIHSTKDIFSLSISCKELKDRLAGDLKLQALWLLTHRPGRALRIAMSQPGPADASCGGASICSIRNQR